jgi:hypothetical protein
MLGRVGDGIQSRPTEGVAPAQPHHAKPTASEKTVASDGLRGVIGARRNEPAGTRQPGRNEILIRSYQSEGRGRGGSRQWLTRAAEWPD